MIPKPLSQITEAVLTSLIENKVQERKDLDYKRELPERNDEQKREFLSDISSFANTVGGDLIFGIDAPSGDGVPVGIPGVPATSLEDAKLWIENVLRTGLQPRLTGYEVQAVPLDSGCAVLIIRIPKSWAGPHRVIFRDHGHFYARNSSGKYRLDVDELRSSFLLSETIADRIQTFRADRVARIKSGDTALPLKAGPKLAVHILPLAAFGGTRGLDISVSLRAYLGQFMQPGPGLGRVKPFSISSGGWDHVVNLEGRVVFPARYGGDPAGRSYTQFFRLGAIEAAVSIPTGRDQNGVSYASLDRTVEELRVFIPAHLSALVDLGVEFPTYVFLSFIDIGGALLKTERFVITSARPIDRTAILLPEFTVEALPINTAKALREPLETIWNAAGNDFCPYFKPGAEDKWWNEQ
jgi:hypothetical protein